MSKENILFIINPISGGKKKQKIPGLIDAHLDKTKFNPNYSFTEYIGHAAELAEEAANKNFDVIVAVGGDGTINEVAPKVMQLNKTLGIIPFGSGNGLARSLKIPMDSKKAIQLINTFDTQIIDAAKLNNKYFFNMAGMGFDAHISAVFAGNKRRGLKGYIEMGLKEMIAYKPQSYQLEIDGVSYTRDAFVVSIANSSQYGNNVYISPKSSLTDGLLDVCIVKPFPLYKLPILAYQMVRATTDKSEMIEIIRGKNIKITRMKEDSIHLDGEPFFMGKNLEIEVIPSVLKVISAVK
ncbi:YegS/Rv2252/BmrU family lipid kinase [Pedobacter sp. LMG 31464]|uniref:YegS/Rv2252/BmrU family lipid kinase n=1 Tax=Pedobacter planticolens TaxID=2679964 RepID=A0A923E0I3_9SPHI|nr:diacylglycerol kinase family protein [Pedobacter planticolens]MBB2146015.1 YegS/Rv2252/BmrU family lipid kinase [Pedobacter planticolens]